MWLIVVMIYEATKNTELANIEPLIVGEIQEEILVCLLSLHIHQVINT